MKLPNDLIKATDYSKAKDREIHEFEYKNGKYIHKYILGGEHELTPQEIIDCLNAISTIDCDLQTAYAYIQGQKDKIASLEAKLAESERQYQEYRQTVEKDIEKEVDERMRDTIKEFNLDIFQLEQQLADMTKKYELASLPMGGLVDTARNLEKQLDEKHKEIKELTECNQCSQFFRNRDKISFAVEQLEQLRHDIWTNQADDGYTDMQVDLYDLNDTIDVRIMQIKEHGDV